MHNVKIYESGAAVTFNCGIPAEGVIAQPSREIDGLHGSFSEAPAERGAIGANVRGPRRQPRLDTPIGCEHGNLIAALREALGQGMHFDGRAAEFEERCVCLRDVQDSHCSRRIFFRDLAKTLKRNSLATRSRPRSPILRARAGLARKVSMQVASWVASPCCTRYPVTPSCTT